MEDNRPKIIIYSDSNEFSKIEICIREDYREQKREDVLSKAIQRAYQEFLFKNRNFPVDNMPTFNVKIKNVWK